MLRHHHVPHYHHLIVLSGYFQGGQKQVATPRAGQQCEAAVATEGDKVQVPPAVISFEIPGHSMRVYPTRRFASSHACAHVWGTHVYVGHPPEIRKKLQRPANDHPWKRCPWKRGQPEAVERFGGAGGGYRKSTLQDFPPPPPAPHSLTATRGHF